MNDRFSSSDYKTALEKSSLSPLQKRMLIINYRSLNHTITATQMAELTDFPDYNTANLHYGKVGRKIGNFLGCAPLPAQKVNVLVDFDKRLGEWHWIMWPELVKALEDLNWVKKGESIIHEKCVYTIAHVDRLNEIYYRGGNGSLKENKKWSSGHQLLQDCMNNCQKLLIIFSNAVNTTYLHSYAYINDIIIDSKNNTTEYYFENMHIFAKKYRKSKLIRINNKPLSQDFIRPYAICFTPMEIINKNLNDFKQDDIVDGYVDDYTINISSILNELNDKMKKIPMEKRERIIRTSIRNDSRIIKMIKHKHNYKCQFPGCGKTIKKKHGKPYIEVAHIHPVARGGKSIIGNLLVLCPNHHKEFDLGDLKIISQSNLKISGELNNQKFTIKIV